MLGWLIYEASLDRLWTVRPGWESLPDRAGEPSQVAAGLIARLADAARELPWPEFAPRAVGAVRALALVESKRDTEASYDAAWVLHQEARNRHASYRDSHGDHPDRDRYLLDLAEVQLQLALAETGTACRTAERVIGLWAEELAGPDPEWGRRESMRWTQRMFRELSDGAATGELALAVAERIEAGPRFVHRVDERRLTLVTGFRNPAIMTCRALLLMYSMCPEMRALGRRPDGFERWEDFQADLRKRFDRAFGYLRRPARREDGADWPLSPDHRRSMVQLCLHLALLTPDHQLDRELPVDGELRLHRLDDPAAEAMSAWLAATLDDPEGGTRQRGDANTIGSASKPSFIASVEACRRDAGAAANYRDWRRRWSTLDRYADRPGRRQRIERILATGG